MPDIKCIIGGVLYFAEMCEITDPELAERHAVALKKMKIKGGAFSQVQPIVECFEKKSRKQYPIGNARLFLLAYYDRQTPAVNIEPHLISRVVGNIAAGMVASGAWNAVYVYDKTSDKVMWVHEV
jgi:hypothetical protein